LNLHEDLLKIHDFVPELVYPKRLNNLEKMVLVLEDRRFFVHSGTDYFSILRETSRALSLKRFGGASTIDMQFVRTVTGRKQRSVYRKLREILLARLIQYRYSKARILRGYISCAFFGSHLIGGDRAALTVFGKQADKLSLEEAAFIAAMLVYPRPLKPSAEWRRKIERRANYGVSIYVRNEQKLKKLKIAEKTYVS
jgi:membrane carboxypeptidase/penicillin-binding protein